MPATTLIDSEGQKEEVLYHFQEINLVENSTLQLDLYVMFLGAS
jgi:hypothetical protein